MEFNKRTLEIRLSKNYQVVAVTIEDIADENQWEIEKEWALAECRNVLNQIDTSDAPTVVRQDTSVRAETRREEKVKEGTFVPDKLDMKLKVSDAQKYHIEQAVSKGFLTYEQVNSWFRYDQLQQGLQPYFDAKKKK